MLALSPRVVDAIFSAIEGYLPRHFDGHPLGCHRPRTADRACFLGILIRLDASYEEKLCLGLELR